MTTRAQLLALVLLSMLLLVAALTGIYLWLGLHLDLGQPIDTRGLHVAEVHRVVDMAHCVHVAPTYWEPGFKNQLLALRDFDFHAVFLLVLDSG